MKVKIDVLDLGMFNSKGAKTEARGLYIISVEGGQPSAVNLKE